MPRTGAPPTCPSSCAYSRLACIGCLAGRDDGFSAGSLPERMGAAEPRTGGESPRPSPRATADSTWASDRPSTRSGMGTSMSCSGPSSPMRSAQSCTCTSEEDEEEESCVPPPTPALPNSKNQSNTRRAADDPSAAGTASPGEPSVATVRRTSVKVRGRAQWSEGTPPPSDGPADASTWPNMASESAWVPALEHRASRVRIPWSVSATSSGAVAVVMA